MAKRKPTLPITPGSDGEGLLKTIIQKPDDNDTRLVLADWLQENGDAERAEFIRLQINMEREKMRERELLKRNSGRWLAEVFGDNWQQHLVRDSHGQIVNPFSRGFVDAAYATPAQFLEHGAEWFAKSPINYLTVDHRNQPGNPVELLKQCYQSPVMKRLVSFRFLTRDEAHFDEMVAIPYPIKKPLNAHLYIEEDQPGVIGFGSSFLNSKLEKVDAKTSAAYYSDNYHIDRHKSISSDLQTRERFASFGLAKGSIISH